MEPNLVLITVASVLGAIGIALAFVGTLMAMLTALGNKHYIFGALIFLFFPAAFVYGFRNKTETAYAMKLLYIGVALFLAFIGLLWWELTRLGLDFIEVMSTTTPKH